MKVKLVLLNSFIVMILLSGIASATITKMYIGNEEDQLIVGIESLAIDRDAGAGMEIRTYFRKNGIMVNGEEYGAIPGKIRYTFLLAGKNDEGSILKFRRVWNFGDREADYNSNALASYSQLELGYGKGDNILYQ